jgi:G3E family GTPase
VLPSALKKVTVLWALERALTAPRLLWYAACVAFTPACTPHFRTASTGTAGARGTGLREDPRGQSSGNGPNGLSRAGRTTLLNHILSRHSGEPIAIIINEFGNVGIDGQLVVGAEEDIVELNNGCICCTIRGDLTRAIGNILASGRRVGQILIETTGLADPAPIIQSFVLDDTLRSSTELDAIITIVDAKYVTEQLKNDQAREQVAYADVVLINKTDLVPVETVESLSRLVRSLNPLARIYPIQWGDVDVDRLLRVRAFDLGYALRLDPELLTDSAHQHDADIGCVSVRVHGAIDAGRFTRWLNQLVQTGPGSTTNQGNRRPRRRASPVRLPRRPSRKTVELLRVVAHRSRTGRHRGPARHRRGTGGAGDAESELRPTVGPTSRLRFSGGPTHAVHPEVLSQFRLNQHRCQEGDRDEELTCDREPRTSRRSVAARAVRLVRPAVDQGFLLSLFQIATAFDINLLHEFR